MGLYKVIVKLVKFDFFFVGVKPLIFLNAFASENKRRIAFSGLSISKSLISPFFS